MDKLIGSVEGLRDVSRLKCGSHGAAEWQETMSWANDSKGAELAHLAQLGRLA